MSTAVALTGVSWIILSQEDGKATFWKVASVLTLLGGLFSVLVFVVMNSSGRRGKQHGPTSGLVISPSGMALVQGDLKGEMRWDEITQIDLQSGTKGIRIKFAGGNLVIANVYNEPAWKIHDLLMSYWLPPGRLRR